MGDYNHYDKDIGITNHISSKASYGRSPRDMIKGRFKYDRNSPWNK